MAFGGFSEGGPTAPMSEINVTPLVDVMLVLLIIFIVAAPMLTHAVKIDLPRASSAPQADKPEAVRLALNADGDLYWNDRLVGEAELAGLLAEAAARRPQPDVHLRADRTTRYERLAEVMAKVHNAGIGRLAFVTLPNP
ncbi:MAG: biopolymer transporter ExbD [Rhodocyclales bacterium]|nr:biopolymer transporter ExbD [Rhodocyclales bacterium]